MTSMSTWLKNLLPSLATHKYVWRDLVADFVTSEAFRSAPPSTPAAP